MSLKITLQVNNAPACREALDAAIERGLLACGEQAEFYALLLCPVDTGNLKNSISHQMENENTVMIGAGAEYATYVEMGHHMPNGGYVAPQPFIGPSLEKHVPEYQAILDEYLRNA